MRHMDRYTINKEERFYIMAEDLIFKTDKGFCGKAVDRLAQFEAMFEALVKNQEMMSKELEKMRLEGKSKSLRFKEMMTKKLIESNMIIYFKINGIE